MKRCPKCSFLHLDTDEVCDLDGTPLQFIKDSEMEQSPESTIIGTATKTQEQRVRRGLIFTAVAGLLAGALLFFVYFRLTKEDVASIQKEIPPVALAAPPLPEARVIATPIPASSPTPTPKVSPTPETHIARAPVSRNPVSTSGNQSGGQGSVWIRLQNGVRIEADEVWSTKGGYWYRRNGLVTFVKAQQVKAIEKTRREAKDQPAIKLSTATAN